MTVHNATLKRWGETFHFASIDGENWLPLNRPLQPGDEDAFQAALDGDGNFKPLVFARRFLEMQRFEDAEVVFHDGC